VSEAVIQGETIYTGILHDLSDRRKAEAAEKERSNWLESYAENLESEVAQRTADLRKSELKLRDALKKERELNDLKSRFVSMASHEFRTPLSTVLSSTELVEMYLDINNREKIDKNIGRIKKSVDHLNGILNDFLSLEKVETGKIEYKPQMIYFENFVEEILEEVRMSSKSKQQIEVNYSGEEKLNTDPFLMKNILFNLLSNAIKYSPDDKPIFFKVNNKSDELIVKVRDQGIGIPAEDQKNMFSRFFRASNVENIKGTGLGLTIVKKYAELMSGNIIFKSKEGEGTEFVVTFKK
jgi:signal transduction histidine kinase